jgi:hypothetical protein
MAISTFEGVVKGGQIRLRDNVQLPEDTEVYVVIPDFAPLPQARVPRPPTSTHRRPLRRSPCTIPQLGSASQM